MPDTCDCDEGCALAILCEVFDPRTARDVAFAATCFPMSCKVASKQAREIVERVRAGATAYDIMAQAEAEMEAAMKAANSIQGIERTDK